MYLDTSDFLRLSRTRILFFRDCGAHNVWKYWISQRI